MLYIYATICYISVNHSFITTMCLNLSLFFLKTTVNLLHNCTKNFVISLVNTTNRGFRKNEIFICITNWSAGVALNFWQGSVRGWYAGSVRLSSALICMSNQRYYGFWYGYRFFRWMLVVESNKTNICFAELMSIICHAHTAFLE